MLDNVSPFWFNGGYRDSAQIGVPILSLVGLSSAILSVDMPNLERTEIRATSGSCLGANWRQGRSLWQSLKDLDITVDSKRSEATAFSDFGNSIVDTKTVFHTFFRDVVRPDVTQLSLNFVKDSDNVAIPKAMEIVGSCPILKRLTLVNWPGTNKALSELFGGLPGLEEVSLEYCKNLGNVAFVGESRESPVLLKLRTLRKLTLKGLDQMPKITDLLFTMVIRHLSVTHLNLTSDLPIKSVTMAAITALLGSDFAECIEKFPFQDWSLDGVSKDEFKNLEKQFRSYYML